MLPEDHRPANNRRRVDPGVQPLQRWGAFNKRPDERVKDRDERHDYEGLEDSTPARYMAEDLKLVDDIQYNFFCRAPVETGRLGRLDSGHLAAGLLPRGYVRGVKVKVKVGSIVSELHKGGRCPLL